MVKFVDLDSVEELNETDLLLLVRNGKPHKTDIEQLLNSSLNNSGNTTAINLSKLCVIQERKPKGTNGGNLSPRVWQKREINYKEGDLGTLDILTNRITLPPGSYLLNGYSPTMETSSNVGRFTNSTNSITKNGISIWANHYTNCSHIQGIISFTNYETFELQHYWVPDNVREDPNDPDSNVIERPSKAWNLGYRANQDIEIYASLTIQKL